jgi:hypothetical protein
MEETEGKKLELRDVRTQYRVRTFEEAKNLLSLSLI